MSVEETAQGLQYFKHIIESGKTLKLREPGPINQGFSYLLEVEAAGQEWYFTLSRDQINDLPCTKAHHPAANALARSLDKRFVNIDPNLFVTQSRRLVHIEIEWPGLPLMSPSGGHTAASGVWVNVIDQVNHSVAKCLVEMTYIQTVPGGSNPYARPGQVINTVRSNIDRKSTRLNS